MADVDEDVPVSRADAGDEDLDEEVQDFRLLNNLNLGSGQHTLPRRGEKDFEPNPTQHQRSVLDASRQAMHDALAYPRLHHPKSHIIAYYVPEVKPTTPVVVENARGQMFRTMGSADSSNRIWLLPEEALYLLERGSLDIRWQRGDGVSHGDEEDLPMSLQAAYATLLGKSGLTLERYHVYAGLRRLGYVVKRAPIWLNSGNVHNERKVAATIPLSIRRRGLIEIFQQALASLFASRRKSFPATGPLVAPGLWRSYADIYQALHLIQSQESQDSVNNQRDPQAPFQIAFHVWKPSTPFKKSAPVSPDFRIAVVDARMSHVPSLEQIGDLLDSMPADPPANDKKMEVKLKWGHRNVILAVVDTGVVSYLRFSDTRFGQEKLYNYRKKAGAKGGQRKGGSRAGAKRG